MKRLLVAILCALAFLGFGFGSKNMAKGFALTSQDKTEAKNLDIYVGQYEVKPGFVLTVTNENNKLMAQPTGDTKIEFKADAEADMFSSSQENVQLKFGRDEKGTVNSVTVTFDGNSFPAKKIK